MTAVNAWRSGRLAGGTFPNWQTMFQGGDLASLASGDAVAASNGSGSALTIVNDTYDNSSDAYGDQLIRVSVKLTISSTTPTAGSWWAIWFALLNQDGSTYGDGNFPIGASYGTQKTYQPAVPPAILRPFNNAAGAQTVLADTVDIWLPPGIVLPIFGTGGSAPTLNSTPSNSVIKYATFNSQNDAAS